MNNKLGTLAITLGLALGGQEAMASNEPIELGKSKVGDTTEVVRGKIEECIEKCKISLPNGDCKLICNINEEYYCNSDGPIDFGKLEEST